MQNYKGHEIWTENIQFLNDIVSRKLFCPQESLRKRIESLLSLNYDLMLRESKRKIKSEDSGSLIYNLCKIIPNNSQIEIILCKLCMILFLKPRVRIKIKTGEICKRRRITVCNQLFHHNIKK